MKIKVYSIIFSDEDFKKSIKEKNGKAKIKNLNYNYL